MARETRALYNNETNAVCIGPGYQYSGVVQAIPASTGLGGHETITAEELMRRLRQSVLLSAEMTSQLEAGM